jgi:hypothetical protein
VRMNDSDTNCQESKQIATPQGQRYDTRSILFLPNLNDELSSSYIEVTNPNLSRCYSIRATVWSVVAHQPVSHSRVNHDINKREKLCQN